MGMGHKAGLTDSAKTLEFRQCTSMYVFMVLYLPGKGM